MVLSDLLVALAYNTKTYVTLKNLDDEELITFNASGYASVESDLGSRGIKKILVESVSNIVIVLEDATP